MNLITKFRRALYYRKLGKTWPNALREFREFPLTEGDKIVISILIAVGVLLASLAYEQYTDNALQELQQQAQASAIEAVKMRHAAKKNQALVVSMLNGAVIENGQIITLCRLNAAGVCK